MFRFFLFITALISMPAFAQDPISEAVTKVVNDSSKLEAVTTSYIGGLADLELVRAQITELKATIDRFENELSLTREPYPLRFRCSRNSKRLDIYVYQPDPLKGISSQEIETASPEICEQMAKTLSEKYPFATNLVVAKCKWTEMTSGGRGFRMIPQLQLWHLTRFGKFVPTYDALPNNTEAECLAMAAEVNSRL